MSKQDWLDYFEAVNGRSASAEEIAQALAAGEFQEEVVVPETPQAPESVSYTHLYSRVMRDGLTPPDLIVIDGGQGQVNIAKQVIQEELGLDIPIAGLQKNDKHQTHELLFGDPLQVIELSRTSQEFFLLQRIQDEVHRFAITFHRQLRSKNSFSSQLDGIEGLGPKRKQLLMKHFKSLTKIKEATVDEIVTVGIPRAVAEAVQAKLHQGKQEEASLLMEVAEDSESYQS